VGVLGLGRRLQQQAPGRRIAVLASQVASARQRLGAALQRDLAALRERLAGAAASLDALSPLATLARGFAIVQTAADGVIVRDSRSVRPGDMVTARLAQGRLSCKVLESDK